jgi:hypothetical protein
MNHVGDTAIRDRGFDLPEVGDVAVHELDPLELVAGQHELQPLRARAEVERDHRDSLADELRARPRADAAQGAGDQEPFDQASW